LYKSIIFTGLSFYPWVSIDKSILRIKYGVCILIYWSNVCFYIVLLTYACYFVWWANNMISVVFDADVVISRRKWGISDLVTFLHFRTVHGHFWRAINRDSKSSSSSIARVHNKICLCSYTKGEINIKSGKHRIGFIYVMALMIFMNFWPIAINFIILKLKITTIIFFKFIKNLFLKVFFKIEFYVWDIKQK